MKKKIVWLLYDADTAIGINNEGELVFNYELEDVDHTESGAEVYNGQQSVIWNNIRQAFAKELKEMYQDLRSQGKLSYDTIEQAFEEHQAKWPEALFNEDSDFCYLAPLINSGVNNLKMLQGSKEEQRKWWLYNRFRYVDSKYNAGDSLTDVITLRSYAVSDITVTPYADIYPTVKYGSYIVSKRGKRNVATTLECPVDALNDTETYIYSASQLASVGDLSGLKVGYAEFASAVNLQSLKLGDSSALYDNRNLTELYLGNNVLLKTIDVRNCSQLGSGAMKSVDLSGCTNIEEIYFTGTQITGVALPIGGILNTLELPNTITNLTIRNQPKLTTFSITGNSYSNVSTCRIENTDYFLKNETRLNALVNGLPENCRLRLVGVYIDWLANTTEIASFYDKLDKFRGLDINGNNLDDAYVQGTIHISSAKGSDLATLKERYPYITVSADHTECTLTYKTYDGSSVIDTETVLDGGDGTKTNNTSRTATAQNIFTPNGWATTPNGNANTNALKAVTTDRTVYAAYTSTVRTYTATFVRSSTDGGGTLYTQTNVPYGTTPTYGGSTPTTTQGSADDYPFEGWTPALSGITGNTTYTAKFGSPIDVSEISDTWDTIIANIDNNTYKTKYKVGQYKPLDLGTEGIINMQIVAMDADENASGSTIPLSFIGMELLNTTHVMNSTNTTAGGWEATSMRSYLADTILPLIPSSVRDRINAAKKYSSTYDNALVKDGQVTYDKLWIPGHHEITDDSSYETGGQSYNSVYKNKTDFIKQLNNSATSWWLRSVASDTYFIWISSGGSITDDVGRADVTRSIALGFCLGYEAETITDTWQQIFAAEQDGTYKTKYSIGDTKAIDLGTYGTQLMEIVAFDTDDKADGSGKAPITWISKNIITTHRMNPSRTANTEGTGSLGGWEKTEMRSWLKETIKPLIPEEVRNNIVEVTKVSNAYQASDETAFQQTTTDDVWIPGHREIFNSTSYDQTGAVYSSKFTDANSRIKKLNGSASYWWLRSAYDANGFRFVYGYGYLDYSNANGTLGAVLGFCT